MRRSRPARARLAFLSGAATLCLLLLAACEDPSGVGLSVLDIGDGDPRAQVLPASGVASAPLVDPTGAAISASDFGTFRALAGAVQDPLFGSSTAQAYIDFLPPNSVPEGFRDRTIRKATLRLIRSYVYGDTTAPMMLNVHQLEEEWAAVAASADTTFPIIDDVITTFAVAASDSLVEVPLPESWVEANDTTLRNSSFLTLFHGFRLSTESASGAVFGFNGRSSLELITSEDTVRFQVSELFSNIDHEPASTFPEGLAPVQDGSSTALNTALVLDTLGKPALNIGYFNVNADTVASQMSRPTGFVRPLARELALFGTSRAENPVLITTARLDTESASYSFRSNSLTDLFQDFLLDSDSVEVGNGVYVTGFTIGVPPSRASIDAVALVAPPAELGPRAVLVLVPTQD